MRLIVNGEAWVLHFQHWSHMNATRMTQAWFHRGDCARATTSLKDCTIQTQDAAIFIFPTNVLRRRAAFVHGNPVAVKERWSMPFSRALGRREALARLLLRMFPTRKVTKQGRTLLFAALRAIKKHPRSFSMATFMRHKESVRPTSKTPEPYCGTVACIAGHVVLAAGAPTSMAYYRVEYDTLPDNIRKIVARAPHGYASVAELASCLLTGRWDDSQVSLLFHDFSITRTNVDRPVRHWLRTGEKLPSRKGAR